MIFQEKVKYLIEAMDKKILNIQVVNMVHVWTLENVTVTQTGKETFVIILFAVRDAIWNKDIAGESNIYLLIK